MMFNGFAARKRGKRWNLVELGRPFGSLADKAVLRT